MLVGQSAERTGTSERRLCHCERVGLLTSRRQGNGYRDYDDAAEQRVGLTRALRAAGLPTRVIRQVLPCALADGALRPCPGMRDTLRVELARLDQRVLELTQARQTLQQAIAVAENGGSSDSARDAGRAQSGVHHDR